MRIKQGGRVLPRALLAVLVLSVTASACSNGSPSSSASTSTSRTANTSTTTSLHPTTGPGGTRPEAGSRGPVTGGNQTACSLVSPAEVKNVIGTTVGQPKAVASGSVTTCTYRSSDPDKSVIIEYDTAATASTYAEGRSEIEKQGAKTTSIGGPNLGTEAYTFTLRSSGAPVNTVVTFQGTLQTIVSSTTSAASVQKMSAAILESINAANGGTTTVPAG